MPFVRDLPAPAARITDAEMPVDGCRPGRSLAAKRRKTTVKEPRVTAIATPGHSLAAESLKNTVVADYEIKLAKPLLPRKPFNCYVEKRRNMERWKN